MTVSEYIFDFLEKKRSKKCIYGIRQLGYVADGRTQKK